MGTAGLGSWGVCRRLSDISGGSGGCRVRWLNGGGPWLGGGVASAGV